MILATWLMLIVESWIFFFTCAARAEVSLSDLLGSGLMWSILALFGLRVNSLYIIGPKWVRFLTCHTQQKHCSL